MVHHTTRSPFFSIPTLLPGEHGRSPPASGHGCPYAGQRPGVPRGRGRLGVPLVWAGKTRRSHCRSRQGRSIPPERLFLESSSLFLFFNSLSVAGICPLRKRLLAAKNGAAPPLAAGGPGEPGRRNPRRGNGRISYFQSGTWPTSLRYLSVT